MLRRGTVAVAAVFAIVALAPAIASAAELRVSKSPTRSSPVALAGTIQSGSIYVFTNTANETKRVDFFLDDPSMTKPPRVVENFPPHDFATTAADGTSRPLDTTTLPNGSHTITARVVPNTGTTQVLSSTFTVANGVVPPPPPPPPPPPSTCPVACSNVQVELPYSLGFTSDAGQIKDKNGVGTGFTWVDKPSKATGLIPQNLAVDKTAGVLNVTTTSGLAYTSSNSQDNALGVGVDAPSQRTRIKTTIKLPPAGSGNYEQGGLWFGIDQDNFTKLAIESTPAGLQVQHLLEVGGAERQQVLSGALARPVNSIDLILVADPFDGSVSASYSVNGGAEIALGKFTVPPEFFSFDAAGIDPTIGTRSFAGIFASHRRGPAPVTYSFNGFSVTDAGGAPTGPPPAGIGFDRSSFGGITSPSAMTWGPDGKLYVAELFGKIHRITLSPSKTVVSDDVITTLGSRLTLGLTVDPSSTASNVILWAAHSSPSTSNGVANSSTVTRLSGPNLATRTDVITGLPRAIANHAINGIHFAPDGKLYIAVGGNTGAGAPNTDNTEFGTRAEQPLSAALLVADVVAPGFDGSCENTADFFGPPPCDVKTYSTGLRNMYDFVIHSNGSIYGPVNGLGVAGSYPPTPTAPCFGFASTTSWTAGGQNPGTQDDFLQLLKPGRYYGHPNPSRGECVFDDGHYQHVAAAPNYTAPLYDLGAHKSADGSIEYRENSFCSQLKGNLLIVNYSSGDDITRLQLSSDGTSVTKAESLVGGFNDPVAITQDPDGTIYVGELGGNLVTVLKPKNPASC